MGNPEDGDRSTLNYDWKRRCKKARKQGEIFCDQHYAKEMNNLRRSILGKGTISDQQPSHFMAELTKEVSNMGSYGSSIKEENEVITAFQREVKDLEDCTTEAKLKNIGKQVTPVDVPIVKATTVDDSCLEQAPMMVYKRRENTTIMTMEKLKRNHLAGQMSSVKEDPLLMSSDVVEKVSSRLKEAEMEYFVVTDVDHVPITKANPYQPVKNEGFDPKFLVESPHHKITSEDVSDPLIQNLVHTTSLQKTNNMISEAVSGVAASSVMKYNEHDTSSLDASFSITACMEELKKFLYIPMTKWLKALKELQSEDWRETFICMDEEMRKAWIESLE